ncbi:MAG: cupin domain-containing protein, partial [Pseudomonadota bacterium]
MVRRVVTGHDENGNAIVVSDGPPPFVITNPQRPGYVSTDIWRTRSMPATIVAKPEEPTLGPRRQLPEKHGTVI